LTLQDETTRTAVATCAVRRHQKGEVHMERNYTTDPKAWAHYERARELFRQVTPEANAQAMALLTEAIGLDPNFARAYATLAATHRREWIWEWSQDSEASRRQALAAAQKAVELDPQLPHGYKQRALIYVYQWQHEEAIAEAKRAVELDPEDADNHAVLAEVLNYAGQPEQALASVETAIQLDRYRSAHYPYIVGQACYLQAHRYDAQGEPQKAKEALQKAEDALTHSLQCNAGFRPAHAYLIAIWEESGRHDEARDRMREHRQIIRKPTGERKASAPYKDPALTERLRRAWRMAEGHT